MLTDLEAVFRSLKSELGLRPIYYQKNDRISGHLFIIKEPMLWKNIMSVKMAN